VKGEGSQDGMDDGLLATVVAGMATGDLAG
jgi:hypothetical protein